MNTRLLSSQKDYLKPELPVFKSGDTVLVHQEIKESGKKRTQIFEGIVIARHGRKNLDASFTVRKMAAGGIGVEKVFPLHSPLILKIEKLKSAKTRRAKLYYLRQRVGKKIKLKEKNEPGKATGPNRGENSRRTFKEQGVPDSQDQPQS
ncbi:50S ribosomal protein L19 [Candidatus Berkelbacteria bacterium]|nr:50S ribosomal protein L19 [Candidatus Berkelbacteria bacterium]MBI2588498.1 50S ribosomal protein L19 [Candidatus Berkelbacteria bacterium]MBI4029607.1 50S ribosomal protein L19 [Candidatus Berkelbacteria bacterium]